MCDHLPQQWSVITSFIRNNIASGTFSLDFSEESAAKPPITLTTYRRHFVNHYEVRRVKAGRSLQGNQPLTLTHIVSSLSDLASVWQEPLKNQSRLDFAFWEFPVER